MPKKTTYKKLILKIIVLTLSITLSVGFIYAQFMKEDAIEKLTEVDAKKTTQLVFQSLYSAMEKGWDRSDLDKIIQRINNIDESMVVNVYRTNEVAKEHGDIVKDLEARQNHPLVKRTINNKESLNIVNDESIDYYYPIIAKQECLKCHTQTQEGNVLGVINISYPIDDLKVSLSSIINFFLIFIIIFSVIIFVALFTEFDKYLVKPIKNFVTNINDISSNKDITQRVHLDNNIEEIESMQEVFNSMLDSIEYQFYNDPLTSLPNRKRLIETLAEHKNAVLMIVDIDKFQEINDLYGDKIGNDILKNTAEIIKTNLPARAELYKLHADEYALYYPSDLSYEEIQGLALHINSCIESDTFRVNDSEIFITVTIGIAYGNSLLLNNSDIALKQAKKKKKRYLVYDSSMNIEHEYEQNLKWTKKIKDAIAQDRIEPLFQPIVNSNTKEIVKYEALMRMVDENGEYIAPVHFLELAKKNKLYPELTKIMLHKTFEQFKNANSQVSINLSVQDILNETVHEIILEKLHQYKLGDRIVFEILESEGIENFEEVSAFVYKMKKIGCKIAIDDFGTGYSNFEYIIKLNIDILKIDGSLIKNIDTNENLKLTVSTIVSFAKKLNIQVVAEFVHSKEVYEIIKDLGITHSQGYYLHEPEFLS